MKTVVQGQFSPPSDIDSIAEDPLVLHQRTDPSKNKHVAIFVHGLGGSRYGKNNTWGSFPGYLFNDFPQLDIGMYSFRSGIRRLNFFRSISVPREAEVLADVLRSLRREGRYDWFILIGHSLGGLLCKGALTLLAQHRTTVERVSDLVLMATPQLGSLRVPQILRWTTHDARVLRAHSEYIQGIMDSFSSSFHCAVDPPLDDKYHVRVWAVVAAADIWVDALSAGIGISDQQRVTVAGSHTDIVKPIDQNADAYLFVHNCLKQALEPKVVPFRTETCRPARKDELSEIRRFARQFFPEPVSELSLMEAWWSANHEIFQLVERITKSRGRVVTETVGYFCVLPLTTDATEELKCGKITGATLNASHIAGPEDRVAAVYIGGVAGTNKITQGAAMHFLQAHLQHLSEEDDLRVLTRPVTDDGLRLVLGYSFYLVDPSSSTPMGALHECILTAPTHMLRKSHPMRTQATRSKQMKPQPQRDLRNPTRITQA